MAARVLAVLLSRSRVRQTLWRTPAPHARGCDRAVEPRVPPRRPRSADDARRDQLVSLGARAVSLHQQRTRGPAVSAARSALVPRTGAALLALPDLVRREARRPAGRPRGVRGERPHEFRDGGARGRSARRRDRALARLADPVGDLLGLALE